jgi:CspA family cold shock protein
MVQTGCEQLRLSHRPFPPEARVIASGSGDVANVGGPVRTEGGTSVQGVIKSYDPGSGDGVVLTDTDLAEYDLAADALDGSLFRMLRQGQRVIFELDPDGRATRLGLGSEADMATPSFPEGDLSTPTPPSTT